MEAAAEGYDSTSTEPKPVIISEVVEHLLYHFGQALEETPLLWEAVDFLTSRYKNHLTKLFEEDPRLWHELSHRRYFQRQAHDIGAECKRLCSDGKPVDRQIVRTACETIELEGERRWEAYQRLIKRLGLQDVVSGNCPILALLTDEELKDKNG